MGINKKNRQQQTDHTISNPIIVQRASSQPTVHISEEDMITPSTSNNSIENEETTIPTPTMTASSNTDEDKPVEQEPDLVRKSIDEKKDNEWLENKHRELMNMYQNLHPSKKFDLESTIIRNAAAEERKLLLEEKKRQRLQYYGQRIAGRRQTVESTDESSNVNNSNVPPIPIVHVDKEKDLIKPKKDAKPVALKAVPRNVIQKSPPKRASIEVKQPFIVNQEQLFAKKFVDNRNEGNDKAELVKRQQEARKLKQQIEEEAKMSEAKQRLEKKQEDKERGKWLSQMKESDINERKKKYLEEKKLEKMRKQEEERKKKIDHQKKMKAIKGRKKQLNLGLTEDEEHSDVPVSVVSLPVAVPEKPKQIEEKDPEAVLKEEERKQAQKQHRQNFKAFIKAQKKSKQASDVAVDIVVPTSPRIINSSPKSIVNDVVIEKKEKIHVPPIQEEELSIEIEEDTTNSPSSPIIGNIRNINECEEDSVHDKCITENLKLNIGECAVDSNRKEEAVEKTSESDEVVRYLLEHNLQLDSPLQRTEIHDKQEKLSIRIEHLREYCERKFGEELFLKLYKHLRDVGPSDDGDQGVHNVLGPDEARLYPYIQKVQQLIYCEDIFYAH